MLDSHHLPFLDSTEDPKLLYLQHLSDMTWHEELSFFLSGRNCPSSSFSDNQLAWRMTENILTQSSEIFSANVRNIFSAKTHSTHCITFRDCHAISFILPVQFSRVDHSRSEACRMTSLSLCHEGAYNRFFVLLFVISVLLFVIYVLLFVICVLLLTSLLYVCCYLPIRAQYLDDLDQWECSTLQYAGNINHRVHRPVSYFSEK